MPSQSHKNGVDDKNMLVMVPRRNSSSALQEKRTKMSSPKLARLASDEHTCGSNGRDTSTYLNSFNDMGHLSRRIFNEGGENHLTSTDFENSFGFRKVFENQVEVTAITPTTIAKCIGSILHGLIVRGENLAANGHRTVAPKYDLFCGEGKSCRRRTEPAVLSPVNSPGVTMSKLDPFQATRRKHFTAPEYVPNVEKISEFVSKLCNDAQMEYECMIIALIYVRRLIKRSKGQLLLLSRNWKGIVLACIILSNKVWDDFHMRNADYCYIFRGLTLQRVNALENLILHSIDYCCNVSPSMYAETHFEIQAMITLTTIEHGQLKKVKSQYSLNKFSKGRSVDGEDKDILGAMVSHPHVYQREHDQKQESSTRLSVREPVDCEKDNSSDIPTLVFTGNCDSQSEFRASRKFLQSTVEGKDNDSNKDIRVLIQYETHGLIRTPSELNHRTPISSGIISGGRNSSHGSSCKYSDRSNSKKSSEGSTCVTVNGGCCLPFFRQAKVHNAA